MSTLRRRLLLGLIGTLGLSMTIAGAAIFARIDHAASDLFDYQLAQVAANLPARIDAQPEPPDDGDPDNDILIEIWDQGGHRVYPTRPAVDLKVPARLGYAEVFAGGRAWRTFGARQIDRTVVIAQPLSARYHIEVDLLLRGIVPFIALIPIFLAVIWWTVGRALAPLQQVTSSVARRSTDRLDPVDDHDLPGEVVPLVAALNDLLARLKESANSQKAFVADAAHELRSPLTALKLQLQLAERAGDAASRSKAFEKVHLRLDRTNHMVEQLLVLARQDVEVADRKHVPVDLVELAQATIEDFSQQAEARGNALSLTPTHDSIVIRGDAAGLRILLGNLIDNALRYSPPGSPVVVAVERSGSEVRMQVSDRGPGIPVGEREHVFRRFYRSADAQASGTGLGLAIVQQIADIHGASTRLSDSELAAGLAVGLAVGLTVTVTFPSAMAAQH